MNPHEAFLKAIRVEPNEPFHEQVYGDFLREEGYDPPDEYLRQARRLTDLLHSARRVFRLPHSELIGPFGLELLLSCRHLDAMRELHLTGYVILDSVRSRGRPQQVVRVVPNIGERGVVRLVQAPLIEQITLLDVRFNNLGEGAVDALVRAPGLRSLTELMVHEPERPFSADQWARLEDHFGERLKRIH
jgi:hypothetical protein